MPDASGGIAGGLFWVATGKSPMEAFSEEDEDEDQDEEDPEGYGQPGPQGGQRPQQGWGPSSGGWGR
jgi:hypothetical protein